MIVSVEPDEGTPESFTLRDDSDNSYVILISEDIDYGFDLEHLREHMEMEEPVNVLVEDSDGEDVATAIEDA